MIHINYYCIMFMLRLYVDRVRKLHRYITHLKRSGLENFPFRVLVLCYMRVCMNGTLRFVFAQCAENTNCLSKLNEVYI